MAKAEPGVAPETDVPSGTSTALDEADGDAPRTTVHRPLPTASSTDARTEDVPTGTIDELDDHAEPAESVVGVDDETARSFWGEDEVPRRPEAAPTRGRRTRRRGRRVERVVRNVSAWSVFKVAVPFFVCTWVAILISGTVLWEVSDQAGLIGNAESFWAEATGNETVEWDGEVVFRAAALASGVLALASVGFAVLFAVLFNLICDVTGGIRVNVLELEPRPGRAERRQARRSARRGPGS